jgi:hypothetical protein
MTPVLLIMADLYPKMCEALKQRAEAAASP